MNIREHLPNIRRGVWISPSKKRITFDFVGDLEFEQNKKIASQEIPLSSAWVVQDLGPGMLTFSIQMLFSGNDADSKCKFMIEALAEMGSGMLLHPAGENILCVATGWKHQPTSVEKIRLAKLSVSFIKTLKQAYPGIQRDFEGDIELAQRDLLGASKSLMEKLNNLTFDKVQSFKKTIDKGMGLALRPFKELAGISTAVSNTFFLGTLKFQNLLDIDAPIFEILHSVGNLCSLFREFDISLDDKKSAYNRAIARILGSTNSDPDLSSIEITLSEPHSEEIKTLLKSIIISRFFAFKKSEFNSIELADFASENIVLYKGFLCSESLEEDEAVQLLQALQLSIGAITEFLKTYPKCKIYILPEDSTPINLAYELYGDVEHCGKIIDDNHLTTEEIFFLPKGKKVVYFG